MAMHYFTLIVISAQKMLMRGFDTKLREVYQVGNDFWRVIAPIPVTLSFIWISQKAPLWKRRTRVDINAQRTDWTACARSSVHLKELFVIKNQCITSTISAIRRRNRQKFEERRRNVLSCFTFWGCGKCWSARTPSGSGRAASWATKCFDTLIC